MSRHHPCVDEGSPHRWVWPAMSTRAARPPGSSGGPSGHRRIADGSGKEFPPLQAPSPVSPRPDHEAPLPHRDGAQAPCARGVATGISSRVECHGRSLRTCLRSPSRDPDRLDTPIGEGSPHGVLRRQRSSEGVLKHVLSQTKIPDVVVCWWSDYRRRHQAATRYYHYRSRIRRLQPAATTS